MLPTVIFRGSEAAATSSDAVVFAALLGALMEKSTSIVSSWSCLLPPEKSSLTNIWCDWKTPPPPMVPAISSLNLSAKSGGMGSSSGKVTDD